MDWMLSALTYLTIRLLARDRWEGFVVGLVGCACWLVFCVQEGHWGLVALQLAITWEYGVGLRRSRQHIAE